MAENKKKRTIIKAGVSKDIITPPIGTPLAGYAFEKSPSIGIHDQLWVRVLILENNTNKVALAMSDVIGFDSYLIEKVNSYTRKLIDIPEDNIVLGATHTHAGPVGFFGFKEYDSIISHVIGPYVGFKPDECLIDITARKIAGAFTHALRNMNEVTVGTLVGTIDEIGKNRRNPKDVNDPDDTVTLFEGKNGPLCILYSYACHPTVLHQDNRYISADFPGFSNAQLEKVTSALPLYMTGAAGDISTRYTRRESSFDEVHRFGSILAGETLRILSNIRPEEVQELDIMSRKVQLPVKKLPPKEKILENLNTVKNNLAKLSKQNASPAEMKSAETYIEGAKITLDLLTKSRITHFDDIEIELKLLKIGDTAVLFVPGEMFAQIGKAIKEYVRSRSFQLHVCCYANGYIGYIPTKVAFKDHDYESWAAIVGENTESVLIETAKRLIDKL